MAKSAITCMPNASFICNPRTNFHATIFAEDQDPDKKFNNSYETNFKVKKQKQTNKNSALKRFVQDILSDLGKLETVKKGFKIRKVETY